ncbi:MAG: polysaccharide biosynthesis tyrosine autokinase [Pseudomonadota bacterium]
MDTNTTSAVRSLITSRQDEGDDEIDLRKLWHTLWHRKWPILALTAAVTLVAILVALSLTPIYRATASILIEEKTANVVSIEQIYGVEGRGNEYLQTQLELLRSRALAERVVRQLKLTEHKEFDPRQQPKPLISLGNPFANFSADKIVPGTMPADLEAQAAATETQIFDSVTRALMARTTIAPQGKSYVIKVSVDMADARLAAAAANALAHGFIEMQLEAGMDMSLTATNWMNSRLGELHVNLKKAEDKLQAFREAENLVDLEGVTTISANELQATGERMIDARRQRAEAESQYRQVATISKGDWERLASVPAVLGHPLIQTFKGEEARARSKVEELSRRYGPRHPVMEAAKSELNAASASLRSQVEQVVAGIERNYQLALANENSLQSSFNANRAQIQDISRKEFRLRELQRDVDTNRTLYGTFLTRLKETAATADLRAANARVVDSATLPSAPVKPNKPLIVMVAMMLSLMVGVALTLLLEALNNTFKGTDQVEGLLNLPVFGILPLMKGAERNVLARMFSQGKDSRFSESIRTIRTGVVLSGMDHPHQVMVVTSTVPGEGKTTVSANLAFALGQMEKVLLVDADLRRPTVSKSFEFPVGTPGLANLIAGTARIEECIRTVDGIDIIGAGAVPPNPLELLSSPNFDKVLDELKTRYERIVIDSPPTQAVSDATVLATHAHTLLYVVRAASTPIPLVQKGIGQLLQNNAPVNGIILNQLDLEKAQKYGYGYGSYYTYYGSQGDGAAD